MYQFQHHVKTQGNNVEGLHRKMTNLVGNHFDQPGVDTYHCKMVADYVKLLGTYSTPSSSLLVV